MIVHYNYEVYMEKLKASIKENKARQNFEEKLANNIKNDSKVVMHMLVVKRGQ